MWAFIYDTSTCSNKFLLYSDLFHSFTISPQYTNYLTTVIIGTSSSSFWLEKHRSSYPLIERSCVTWTELKMKNIGTFSPGEGSALLSKSGSIDRAAGGKPGYLLVSSMTHSPVQFSKMSLHWTSKPHHSTLLEPYVRPIFIDGSIDRSGVRGWCSLPVGVALRCSDV